MRIGCLQFAPQVGDVDNNLNRADAVLSRANPDDLDVLVLPELAFSGKSFIETLPLYNYANFDKGIISSHCKTSPRFSNPPAPASHLSGPGRSLSSTTVSSLLDTPRKSTFLQNGLPDPNTTTRSSSSMEMVKQLPTTGSPFFTRPMRHGHLKATVDSTMALFPDLETPALEFVSCP